MYQDPMHADLLRKIPQDADYSAHARQIIDSCFSLRAGLLNKQREIEDNRTLSSEGKRSAKRDHVVALAKSMREQRGAIRKSLDHVSAQQQGLRPKAPDRTDIFGEMRRQEARTFLRGLGEHQRLAAAISDPDVMEAVLGAAPALSGLKPDVMEHVSSAYAQVRFPADYKRLSETKESYEAAEAALGILTTDACSAIHVSQHQMKQLIEGNE